MLILEQYFWVILQYFASKISNEKSVYLEALPLAADGHVQMWFNAYS